MEPSLCTDALSQRKGDHGKNPQSFKEMFTSKAVFTKIDYFTSAPCMLSFFFFNNVAEKVKPVLQRWILIFMRLPPPLCISLMFFFKS